MIDDVIFGRVCEAYLVHGSVNMAARVAKVPYWSAQKMLIEAGLYMPEDTTIIDLWNEGYSVDEIMKITGKSRSCVIGKIPYSRHPYCGESKTPNAVHIAEWRKRKAERSTEGRSKNNVD